MTDATTEEARSRVPVRTILTTIGLVLATGVAVLLVTRVERVLIWMAVALFFAVALYPVVDWVQRHVTRGRRSLATLLVFVLVLVVLGGLLAVFAVPLAQEGTQVAGQLPPLIADARAGRGPVGDLLTRVHALEWVQNNQDRIREFATGLGTPALGVVQAAGTAVVATVTIFVLAYLAVLEGPKVVDGSLALFPPDRAERIRRVTHDCAKTVTGYISGNLLISVICGLLTYAVLKIAGVPFAGLIALFVAITDLIPLVGATIGAVVATIAGFVHSVPAGIAVLVFFVLYQQLENHLLQPLIFARTVKLNPLTVLVAILVAVELAGILGALLAIPAAGIIQVILRDVWDHRRGRPKPQPTVGPEQVPVDQAGRPATAG
ncbi:AI-2E family transporter [Pseudonocardia xinjiangensis]|uniref:AI-2E family transporter n=1 Tax=Pseudonocardia xinjiangensis TaxID=75289 RepID=A0ABX1RAY0_9PSEU|nr:AI-2E family transporter [Pseudonocardia xinjiangensis]NMH77034.1 AI-2E family transporter [Pseudonocardia xinjiangensis]